MFNAAVYPGNPIFRPRGGVASSQIYFDSDAADGGDGTSGAPYNTLDFFATLSGNQNDTTFFLKKNSVFLGTLVIPDGVSNYSIRTYGAGQPPVVANWVEFTPTWTSILGTNEYYFSDAEAIAANVPIALSTVLYHTKLDRLGTRRNSLADLDLIYEHSVWTLYSANDIQETLTYYDSGLNRFYYSTDVNPAIALNGRFFYPDVAEDYAGNIGTGTNVTIEEIWFYGGYRSSLKIGHIDGLTLRKVRAAAASGPSASFTPYAAEISGTSEADKLVGLTIDTCQFGNSLDSTGFGLKLSFIDTGSIRGSWFHDISSGALQFAESCVDITIERNRFETANWLMELRTGSATTHHQNILVRNNLFNQRTSYSFPGAVGAGTPTGYGYETYAGDGKNFSDLRIVNNTFIVDDAWVLHLLRSGAHALGNHNFKFKNNLVIVRQDTAMLGSEREPVIYAPTTAGYADSDIDYNVYQFLADQPMFQVGGSTATDQTSYRALWAATSAPTNANEQHSIVVAAATAVLKYHNRVRDTNYYPASGSAPQVGVADTGDADYPTEDFYGFPRSTGTVGAVEYQSAGFYSVLGGANNAGRSTVGGSWNITGSQDGWDNDNTGEGRSTGDYLVGFSFPSVTATGPISYARLEFAVLTQHVPGEFRVHAQSAEAAPIAIWSSTNKPEYATKVSTSVKFHNQLGRVIVDVTDMVNEVLAGANWVSGGRMNFWLEACSVAADVTTGNEATNTIILAMIP